MLKTRRQVAFVGAAMNSAKWAVNDEVLEGSAWLNLRHGNFGMATQIAAQGLVKAIDRRRPGVFDFKTRYQDQYNPAIADDIITTGGESTVIRFGEIVKKYLTGKTQDPEELEEEINARYEIARQYLGEFLLETEVYRETAELFIGVGVMEYVVLEQPLVDIKFMDPHRDVELLKSRPDIKAQVDDLFDRLEMMFIETGYFMDDVLSGNLVWAEGQDGEPDKLRIIDTSAAHEDDDYIIGLKAPLWEVERYRGNFVESMVRVDFDGVRVPFVEDEPDVTAFIDGIIEMMKESPYFDETALPPVTSKELKKLSRKYDKHRRRNKAK